MNSNPLKKWAGFIVGCIIGYFKILWIECKKLLPRFKEKPKNLTVKEVVTICKGKNMNELVQILTGILAEKQRAIPICTNKKEVKTWGKKKIIAMIVAELVQRKQPEMVNKNKVQEKEQLVGVGE
jgi:hypothetical protein